MAKTYTLENCSYVLTPMGENVLSATIVIRDDADDTVVTKVITLTDTELGFTFPADQIIQKLMPKMKNVPIVKPTKAK